MSLATYLKGTKEELKHVNWPTREQAVGFTMLVIGISLIVAILLGAFDAVFTFILEVIITNG